MIKAQLIQCFDSDEGNCWFVVVNGRAIIRCQSKEAAKNHALGVADEIEEVLLPWFGVAARKRWIDTVAWILFAGIVSAGGVAFYFLLRG